MEILLPVADAGFQLSARVFVYGNRTYLYFNLFGTCDESHYYKRIYFYCDTLESIIHLKVFIVKPTIKFTLSNVARLGNLAYQGMEVCNCF